MKKGMMMRIHFGRTAALVGFALVGPALASVPHAAFATSDAVRASCRNDYYSHCPQHALGSTSLRQCMKTAGPQLSSGCIKALVASGEISSAEVQAIARKLKQQQH